MSEPPRSERAIIAGAGLAGALMACFLARAGYRVDVYERRPDPRKTGFAGGRSINLALSTRGITALERVGLADRVLADAIPMRGRMIHDAHGNLRFQAYSRVPGEHINSVSRGGLNIALIDAADAHANVVFHFGMRCVGVDFDRPAIVLEDETTAERSTAEADFIIGADGAFSAVRDAMLHTVFNFDYEQSFLEHGYKELSVPGAARAVAASDDQRPTSRFAMEPNALHIWPRGGSMMIALPNPDGSFTCTLFWPYDGDHAFSAVRSRDDIAPFFRRLYPDAVPLMPTLAEDYETNPVGSLVTIRCAPWHVGDRVVILGDAAHAIVPFFGQGMNAAFEDCRVLDECLKAHRRDRTRAFDEFFRLRKSNADAIASMALDNFIEMRDRTASRWFRARKKIENLLHKWMPRAFVPLYNMISFTNIPYAEAQRRARSQRLWFWLLVIGAPLALIAIVTAALAFV